MLEILKLIMPMCGIVTRAQWPNCCSLDLYESGQASMDWRADDEALFNGLVENTRMISLSLGNRRTFEIRVNTQKNPEPSMRFPMNDGDILTMEGMFQKHYTHRVPPEHTSGPR